MRGFLCAAMNKFPNDPQLLALSGEELLFTYHHKRKYLGDIRNDLGTILGTRWTPESVHAVSKGAPRIQGYYDFPLALLLQPKLGKNLKSMVPKPKKQKFANGEAEFEDVFGKNLIREHQKRLLAKADKILNA